MKSSPMSAAEEGRMPHSSSITPQLSRIQTEDEEVKAQSSYKESDGQRFRDFIRGAFTGRKCFYVSSVHSHKICVFFMHKCFEVSMREASTKLVVLLYFRFEVDLN